VIYLYNSCRPCLIQFSTVHLPPLLQAVNQVETETEPSTLANDILATGAPADSHDDDHDDDGDEDGDDDVDDDEGASN